MSALDLQKILVAPSPINWDKAAQSNACSSSKVRSIAASGFATLAILFSGASCYLSLQTVVVLANIHTLLTLSCLFLLAAAVMKLWPNSVSDPAHQAVLLEKIKTEVNQGAYHKDLARRYPLSALLSKDEINAIFTGRMNMYTSYQDFMNKEGEEAFDVLDDVRKGTLIAKNDNAENHALLTTETAIVSYFVAKGWGFSTIEGFRAELLANLSEDNKKQLKSFILKRDCASLASNALTLSAFLDRNTVETLEDLNPQDKTVLIQAFKALNAEEMVAIKELGLKLFGNPFEQALVAYQEAPQIQQAIEALEKSYEPRELELKRQANLQELEQNAAEIALQLKEAQDIYAHLLKAAEIPDVAAFAERIQTLEQQIAEKQKAMKAIVEANKALDILNKRLPLLKTQHVSLIKQPNPLQAHLQELKALKEELKKSKILLEFRQDPNMTRLIHGTKSAIDTLYKLVKNEEFLHKAHDALNEQLLALHKNIQEQIKKILEDQSKRFLDAVRAF